MITSSDLNKVLEDVNGVLERLAERLTKLENAKVVEVIDVPKVSTQKAKIN
jgi:predicted chitinase